MTQIITLFSPKTAGASSVALNLASLQALASPQQKIGLLELSPWSSQQVCFASQKNHTWKDLLAFQDTTEWNDSLLVRTAANLGAEIFWSPALKEWPVFDEILAENWKNLLCERYQTLYLDLNSAVPEPWQRFWLSQSTQVLGVVTPDPVSLKAWENWTHYPANQNLPLSWVLNQVSRVEMKRLQARFSSSQIPLLGILRQDSKRFWQQFYQGFLVVWQKRSGFKNDVADLLQKLI